MKKTPAIGRFPKRMPINAENQLNDQRFENINKNPSCYTKIKNTGSIDFRKHRPRDLTETLFPLKPFQTDYDKHVKGKDFLLKTLATGSVDWRKDTKSRDARGTRNSIAVLQGTADSNEKHSVDASKVWRAQ